MSEQPQPGVAEVAELDGGPFAGMLAPIAGNVPAVLLGPPFPPGLLEAPSVRAVWNPRAGWYEREP